MIFIHLINLFTFARSSTFATLFYSLYLVKIYLDSLDFKGFFLIKRDLVIVLLFDFENPITQKGQQKIILQSTFKTPQSKLSLLQFVYIQYNFPTVGWRDL